MRYALFIWLLLCAVLIQAQGQVAPFARMGSTAAGWTPAEDDSATVWAIASDVGAFRASGDTTSYLPNKIVGGFSFGNIYSADASQNPVYYDSTGIGKGKFLWFDGSNDAIKTQLTTAYTDRYAIFAVFRVYKRGGASANDIIRDNHSAVGLILAQGVLPNGFLAYDGANISCGVQLSADTLYATAFTKASNARVSIAPSGLTAAQANATAWAAGARYGSLSTGVRSTYLMLYEVMETRSINQIPRYKQYILDKYGLTVP